MNIRKKTIMDIQEGVSDDIVRRRATHLRYYNKRYQTDMEFRIKETGAILN